jgi:tetratricopeptide (TPR) repeat protein
MSTGCSNSPVSPKRPVADKPVQTDDLLSIEASYHQGKYLEALSLLDSYLSKHPNNPDALFLQGLVYFQSGDLKGTRQSFSRIPQKERSLLAESCLELRELNSAQSKDKILELAREFFTDCLQELETTTKAVENLTFTKDQIMKYGQFYDQVMGQEDDAEIRRMKEEAFLKKYSLSEDQLGEITSRYLDYLAEGK